MKSLFKTLSKYQYYILGIAIFLALSAVSFSYTKGQSNLFLEDYPSAIIILVVSSIVFILIYTQIDKFRIGKLTNQVDTISKDQTPKRKDRIGGLSPQQKKVFDLIMSGKSNKEIMADLFIEKSTLKSHINQLYKKLEVKNRQELRATYTV